MRLFLCEKPSQGKDIARVLGAYHQANGHFKGAGFSVTWCIGHLVEAAPPEAYDERFKRWSLDDLPIIPGVWRVNVKANTAAQFMIIKQLLAQTSELVIATDADREGEMIAREVLELCRYEGVIRRLWLSALNEASIRKALCCLRPAADTVRLYHSALARSRADWMIGMNMTRLFTVLGRRSGHDDVLSVGRVQTPTLRLVVDRDHEIQRFVSEPYWSIDVRLVNAGQVFLAQWVAPDSALDKSEHCIRRSVAQRALEQLQCTHEAIVVELETLRISQAPPLPFDLSTLQETCSLRFGFDVMQTLELAQSLYETHKAITYPRTDTGYLPVNMLADTSTVFAALVATDPQMHLLMHAADCHRRSGAWNDDRVTAHHGIIPTLEPFLIESLSENERTVYELIRSHYVAQFFPHREYDQTCVRLICGENLLQAKGKHIVLPGWIMALNVSQQTNDDKSLHSSQVLPPLHKEDQCSVLALELRALKTQAPKAYTQGELIKSMKDVAKRVSDPRLKRKLKDTLGIGTEATRASIIDNLLSRGYLYKKGQFVHACDSALTLIDAVPAALADPATTAIWEQAFDRIESGEMTLESFIAIQSTWITRLVEHYRTTTLALHSPSGPGCPLCGAPMHQRRGKHGMFWSCTRYPECQGVLPVAAKVITYRTHRRSQPKGC